MTAIKALDLNLARSANNTIFTGLAIVVDIIIMMTLMYLRHQHLHVLPHDLLTAAAPKCFSCFIEQGDTVMPINAHHRIQRLLKRLIHHFARSTFGGNITNKGAVILLAPYLDLRQRQLYPDA